ncbi:30S ribosomal protein S9 [Candidatus Nomurabacteria bacterium RIFCSPLOWO2_01_FULL_42_20]|uniref:Small ribosomal subunit protein uS9 n=1 Tax=Candidatus Nomurabacteria bacterium RIFCSPHIGHO2_01_FULL_42_16 TaxID=1801743 RepID=A0A1F6VI21_9BACT|nr:MAG: 30S ribosomal protein S9 [Candidatus Nomurabacteria bacterium RIFCSPHIGHO2_01_FULL_42_16]OGI91263.1 MAG: 30S ribosomal protein S9 [Candidatus Nomurabacteria bacterium RIFCSPLOWO2_01_FULL_42_20]
MPAGRFVEAIGRRKTSVARVRLSPASKITFMVNNKDGQKYFKTDELWKIVNDPIAKTKITPKFQVSIKVAGGGIHSQAEAVRHGLTRAIVEIKEELRSKLKKMGFLKRDSRIKERRKFGLKKARKAPQWSKR